MGGKFFQEGRQPEFRGKAGDQCATDQIASIHVDSLTRIISHFVYDPATGCRDSFSLVVQVPVRKKISFISLEDQLIPGGVRMHALDNRDSIGWPYYSVWAIESASDSYFTGQYTEGHQTINHIFSKTGTYRVSVAEHTCTDNVREVYYTNYSVKAIGCPTYEPFIVYDTPLASDPFLIDFRADGSDLFSAYPTNTVRWYFGDGDSSLQVSPQHRYKSGGTYLVQVVYETVAGCKLSKSIELQLPGAVTMRLHLIMFRTARILPGICFSVIILAMILFCINGILETGIPPVLKIPFTYIILQGSTGFSIEFRIRMEPVHLSMKKYWM